jgi:hypothetical protein
MNDFNLIDELYIQCLESDLNNARDIIQKLYNVLYPLNSSPTIEKLKDEVNSFLNKPKYVRRY